ncbi:hypothetical protein F511_29131 [Dorcoceras hygrometricum]|uniref:Uncharacterized protein n=1 Tax=Dorcoceras hygrometricum TaxID=472368 RepID=A0A2Z7AVG2_9LAMI|nr:hypothetical protein F511_29131 [Dorcoceras hygrometricum]
MHEAVKENRISRPVNFSRNLRTPAASRSNPRSFYSFKRVTIERANHRDSSATKIAQIIDGERRQSAEIKSRCCSPKSADIVTAERRLFIISDRFFNPTAGHSAGTILTTQQLIALQLHRETTTHHSFATIPLTRVDVWFLALALRLVFTKRRRFTPTLSTADQLSPASATAKF